MGYTLKVFLGKEENLIPLLEKYRESQKVDLESCENKSCTRSSEST